VTAQLQGHVAIITGGGRGFGKAIATRLAAEGAAVTVTARTRSQLDSTVNAIAAAGGVALAAAADVTNREDVAGVVNVTVKRFGPVTLMINNAGIAGPFGPIGVVDPDEWWASQAIHVRGTLLFMSAVLPGMIKQRRGRIINIASRGGTEVTPNLSAYGVGKATQIRLTQHVAAEGREHGISAFAIEPGTVFTELAAGTIASPEAQRWLPGMLTALKEIKERDDPAVGLARCGQMCVDLASGRFDGLSGSYLRPQDDFAGLLGVRCMRRTGSEHASDPGSTLDHEQA
jgi:NAD(P)-dependent dehydrogenase (short-subunit alcohol dehydrogenase family)